MKVVILGFYYRDNLGDDVMAYIWTNFFQSNYKNVDLSIFNPDDVQHLPSDTDMVIVGGGDLINNYFMDKITRLVRPLTCPIYAIGVGLPYPSAIADGQLDIFDFIITRNKEDIPALQSRIGQDYVLYSPDLAFYLPKTTIHLNSIAAKYGLDLTTKNIGVYLARPMCNAQSYEQVVNTLAAFLLILSEETGCLPHWRRPKYLIHLFAMNTRSANTIENDHLINQDIKSRLEYVNNIRLVERRIDIPDIPALFSQLYLTIATRFHAHVFSMMAGTPILSISDARKVKSLLATNQLTQYGLPVSNLVGSELLQKMNLITTNYRQYRRHLGNLHQQLTDLQLKNLICNRVRRILHN